MIVTNTEGIPGREVTEVLGVVRGNTVRAKHLGRDILAGLKNLIGGEIGAYTELMTDARNQARDRMIQEAQGLSADAVVNIRYATSMVTTSAAEILAYGTAVKLR